MPCGCAVRPPTIEAHEINFEFRSLSGFDCGFVFGWAKTSGRRVPIFGRLLCERNVGVLALIQVLSSGCRQLGCRVPLSLLSSAGVYGSFAPRRFCRVWLAAATTAVRTLKQLFLDEGLFPEHGLSK